MATLVAQGVPSDALFSAVCDEVDAVVGAEVSVVVRFEADGTVTLMGSNADRHPVGARLELDPDYVVAEVHRTGRAARFDTDDPAAPGMPELVRAERVRSAVACPIVVGERVWGVLCVGSFRDEARCHREARRGSPSSAIWPRRRSRTREPRVMVKRLADEQAALRGRRPWSREGGRARRGLRGGGRGDGVRCSMPTERHGEPIRARAAR